MYFLWNAPTTFKARRNQKGNRTIPIVIWEYANNLQGQKRPERIQNDSYLIWEYANNHQGQKRPGRIKDDSICSCLFMYVGMKAGQQSR